MLERSHPAGSRLALTIVSTQAQQHQATVAGREQLSEHLVRVELTGLDKLASTRTPDEWVGLIVPGQFQSRYYTVRRLTQGRLTLDIVVHEAGLVTEWASRDIVGETVTVTDPKGSFAPPPSSRWLTLVGDLTALPAMARIVEETSIERVRVLAESADELPHYFSPGIDVTWLPLGESSRLADVVAGLTWPEGDGYFWMAGESAQMRAIRKHLMRQTPLVTEQYNVMGYWRAGRRQPRAADPGPIWRAGVAAGKSNEEIWADYDAATSNGSGSTD